jgi:hypothetical protein
VLIRVHSWLKFFLKSFPHILWKTLWKTCEFAL